MKERTVVETREDRWIAFSGLVFVAAWVVGLFISFSSPASSSADWTAYCLDHGRLRCSRRT